MNVVVLFVVTSKLFIRWQSIREEEEMTREINRSEEKKK
jgi:hypothetical protein